MKVSWRYAGGNYREQQVHVTEVDDYYLALCASDEERLYRIRQAINSDLLAVGAVITEDVSFDNLPPVPEEDKIPF